MLITKRVPLRYLFKKIRGELAVTLVVATVVAVIDNYVEVDLEPTVLAYLGSAVSVILVFRTGQAYARWWEARRAWGSIVNAMRTLARQVLTFQKPDSDFSTVQAYRQGSIKRLVAFPYLLSRQLRRQDLQTVRRTYLTSDEAEVVRRYDNQANAVLVLQSLATQESLDLGCLTPQQQTRIDNTLSELVDNMGLCERIKNAIFPGIYSQFFYAFLYLFILLLPLTIVHDLGFIEVPATLMIAVIFFLLEKTAVAMQDPFENLPTDIEMTHLSKCIERDLRQMAGQEVSPPLETPGKFYVL